MRARSGEEPSPLCKPGNRKWRLTGRGAAWRGLAAGKLVLVAALLMRTFESRASTTPRNIDCRSCSTTFGVEIFSRFSRVFLFFNLF